MTQLADVFSNRYEIQRGIARGGMAEVYLARDQLLDRPVAVKVLFAEYARDPSFVERFRREAQSAASLNRPNIVAIYDWGQEGGTYFIVREYVRGRSLRDVVQVNGPFSARRTAEIGAEIAGALEFAHRNGVVHRDVKPGNVLLTADGDIKVTDFGIARAGTSEALTQTGAVMGTAAYFSPEQAQGLPVDGRSDVYSLGVVLYEMVTGAPPFTGESPVAVAYKHVREDPEPPGTRCRDHRRRADRRRDHRPARGRGRRRRRRTDRRSAERRQQAVHGSRPGAQARGLQGEPQGRRRQGPARRRPLAEADRRREAAEEWHRHAAGEQGDVHHARSHREAAH